MTVSKLIEKLQRHVAQYGPNTPVHHSYNYGDHCRTTVAPVVEQVTEERIVESEYHQCPKILDQEDDRFFDPTKHSQAKRSPICEYIVVTPSVGTSAIITTSAVVKSSIAASTRP